MAGPQEMGGGRNHPLRLRGECRAWHWQITLVLPLTLIEPGGRVRDIPRLGAERVPQLDPAMEARHEFREQQGIGFGVRFKPRLVRFDAADVPWVARIKLLEAGRVSYGACVCPSLQADRLPYSIRDTNGLVLCVLYCTFVLLRVSVGDLLTDADFLLPTWGSLFEC